MTTASLWKPAWYAGGDALLTLFISLPVILVIFTVEVTLAWAYAFLVSLLDYNRTEVWNFRSPALWLYLCIIQISISKGSLKITWKETRNVLSIKYSNILILHLFNVIILLTSFFPPPTVWGSSSEPHNFKEKEAIVQITKYKESIFNFSHILVVCMFVSFPK